MTIPRANGRSEPERSVGSDGPSVGRLAGQRSMDDQARGMLRYAAGVPYPLQLQLRTPDGRITDVSTEAPYALIGRGEGCDICIADPSVSYRHVYLQAIGPAVACVDLLSVSGIKWLGPECRGWLSSQHEMRLGNATIKLAGDHWQENSGLAPPQEFRPRDEQRAEYGLLPKVELELLNTSHKGSKWPINRVITLLGRDERCRITIMDDRLSRVQCSLLLLPSGLWVIDLLGKGGIELNGQPVKCGLLAVGQELTVGKYSLTAHYPDAAQIAAELQMKAAVAAAAQTAGSEFSTRSNKFLQTEFYHDTLIILPLGDTRAALYQDMHMEGARVIDLINQRQFRNLIIDFSRAEEISHLLLEVLMAICRATPGNGALCGANERVYSVLQTSPLHRLFQHYANCQDALHAVYLPVESHT